MEKLAHLIILVTGTFCFAAAMSFFWTGGLSHRFVTYTILIYLVIENMAGVIVRRDERETFDSQTR
jgi:hypothetical protein